MTENKRYVVRSMFGKIFIEDDIKRVGVLIGYEEDGKKDNIVKVTNVLNQLNDENEQLKSFQDRVFSWIDMHLQRLPTLRDDEFEFDNEFADPSLYSGAIQILETMKRELEGDME